MSKYSKVLRVSDDADALVRAYAERRGISVYDAATELIDRREVGVEARETATGVELPAALRKRLDKRAAEKGTTVAEATAAVLGVGFARLDALEMFAAKRRAGR